MKKIFASLIIATALSGAATIASGQAATAPLQQTAAVSGQVVDAASGQPVSFVTLVLQHTNTGATTDDSGRFTIEAAPGATLIVTSIGYTSQNVTVPASGPFIISLSRSQTGLDQVVVVGYGTQRKRDITTAISSVSGAELEKQPVLNPLQALQGKAAGVQIVGSGEPGANPQVIIRGTGTILGGTGVLYIVDGIQTTDISNINSADIESMDILKDASATAIYGSQGANGVVIITTKKGVSGKLQIRYNGNVGFKNATDRVKMADAAAYANYVSAGSGTIVSPGQYSTDWYDQILRSTIQENHNVSIAGGSDKDNFLLSFGYFDDKGIIKGSDYKRYNVRINNDYKISKAVKTGVTASYTNFNNQAVNLSAAYQDAYRAAPIIPAIANGKYGNTSSYGNVGNPLLDINDVDHRIIGSRLEGSAYLDARIIKGLTFRSTVGADYSPTIDRAYNYQFDNDESTFITAGGNQRNPNSSLSVSDFYSFRWVWSNTLTYTHSFGDHSFTLLAGTEAQQFKADGITATRKNVAPDPSLWYIGLGDAGTSTNNSADVEFWRRGSYFGRLIYNYKSKYLLTASLRRDGTDQLPKVNQWQVYPSVSAGWVMSSEDFIQNLHVADYLKLRGGWGRVGNPNVPQINDLAANFAYPFGASTTGTNGTKITQITDQFLNWETTEDFDLGLEFKEFNSRLTGEVSYYDKRVLNLFDNVYVQGTIPDNDHLILRNIGSLQNKGWEFALNWSDKITKDFTYHIGGNISFNKNKILNLNGGQAVPDGPTGIQGFVTNTNNGEAIGSFYVYKVVGVFQDQADIDNYKNANGKVIQPAANPGDFKYQDTNGDGVLDARDKIYAGSYQPQAYYAINLGVSYKNFDFSADVYGVTGNQVYNGKKASRQELTDNIEESVAYGRWTPGSGINNEPAANAGLNLPSTYFISSGSFIRLNNITLGYSFPASVYKRAKFSALRVYATAQNLYTYKKYDGFTSELPGSKPTNAGIEQAAYPTTRIIAVGVTAGL